MSSALCVRQLEIDIDAVLDLRSRDIEHEFLANFDEVALDFERCKVLEPNWREDQKFHGDSNLSMDATAVRRKFSRLDHLAQSEWQ